MSTHAAAKWRKAAAKIKFDSVLKQIIKRGLIGKKCWKVTLSYGELTLHLGQRLPYDNPKMAGEKKGEWIFSTCGTEWFLLTPNGVVQPTDEEEEQVEERAKALLDSRIIDFGVTWPKAAAMLFFDNGCRLFVIPSSNDAKFDLPFWEFFMPKDHVMSLGPGLELKYGRSDVAATL